MLSECGQLQSSESIMSINCHPLNRSLDSFVWPNSECPLPEHGSFASETDVPTIDLSGQDMEVAAAIGSACTRSGFFQVVNHGVDERLIHAVHENARCFFRLPEHVKMRAARSTGNSFGFAGKFAGRFTSKCPWKETLSLQYTPKSNIKDFLAKVYSDEEARVQDEDEQHWLVYDSYCRAMDKLGKRLMELIAVSLGLHQGALDDHFAAPFSIFRLNMYPPSHNFSRLLGTGPHTDPCALTILHQDQVGGLQVYRNDSWVTVEPRSDAFVISIGDTFQALCNHRYKSAKHRAVIHATETRHSVVFFINPGLETVIKPIPELLTDQERSQQQDRAVFSWGQLLEFTQKHYRTDVHTLDAFENHIRATASNS